MSSLVRWPVPQPARQPVPSSRIISLPAGLEVPQTISGLSIWLDATKITDLSDGAAVSAEVNHAIGGGVFVQAIGTKQPTYETGVQNGLPVVRFDGSNDNLATTDTTVLATTNAASGITVAFAGMTNAPDGTNRNVVSWSLDTLNTGVRVTMSQRGATSAMHIGGRRTDGDAFQSIADAGLTSGEWAVWVGVLDFANSDAFLYKNGVLVNSTTTFQTSGTTEATNSLAMTTGSLASEALEFWSGDRGELCGYKRALTQTEAEDLSDYLTVKWGIAAGTTATAETAPVTVVAEDASVAVVANAETAEVTAAAQDAVAAVGPVTETAPVTAAAQDAVAVTTTGTVAAAETALVTAAAVDATVAVAAQAVAANVLVDADAGVSHAVTVEAETATATVAAQDATIAVIQPAGTATVAAAAQDATVSTASQTTANAENAAATVVAQDATAAVVAMAQTATVAAAAQDATVSTLAATTAVAETATVAAAAQDATAAVAPVAATATATAAAQNAVFQRFTDATAQTATVTAAAVDPTAAVGVLAETAAVIAAAQDAVAFIPPPVPPPRWMEGGTTGSGLVEGGTTGTGQVEGELVGAGVVEGGASV